MVALVDVRAWNAAALETVVTELAKARDAVVELDYALAAARNPQGWSGAATGRAAAEHARLAERLRRLVAAASAVRRGVSEATDSIAALHEGIDYAEALAAANGFSVAPDGTVTDVDPPTVAPEFVETIARGRNAVAIEVVDRLEQVLRNAETLDNDLAAVLARAQADEIDDGRGTALAAAALGGEIAGGLPGAAPPLSGTPADNAGWWTSLSPAARLQVTREHPEWIGNRNGIPAADRDTANRALLNTQVAGIDAEIATAQTRLDTLTEDRLFALKPAVLVEAAALDIRLRALRDQRAPHQAVIDTLAQPDRHLLQLDLDRDNPRAAVAVGDVDTADHVAVFTPGFTSTVAGSLENYDREVGALRDSAGFELRRTGAVDESVAAVTWIGYDAPQWGDLVHPVDSVASSESASRGGAELAGLLDGINSSRVDDPHLTAIGHSYGSTTAGYALQQATGVDDAVLFGSPGGSTDDIGDLNLAPGHVGVIEARGDPVADLGRFGTDPNQLDGTVGLSAQEGYTPYGRPIHESTGHEQYLTPGTASHYNIASTIAGLDDQRVLGESDGVGDDLRSGDPFGAIGRALSPP